MTALIVVLEVLILIIPIMDHVVDVQAMFHVAPVHVVHLHHHHVPQVVALVGHAVRVALISNLVNKLNMITFILWRIITSKYLVGEGLCDILIILTLSQIHVGRLPQQS